MINVCLCVWGGGGRHMLEHRCRSQRKTDTCLRQDLNSAAHARLAGWRAFLFLPPTGMLGLCICDFIPGFM